MDAQPKRRLLFCERSYGLFFLVWGALLQANHFAPLSPHGTFYRHLEDYAPGWAWGLVMIIIAIGRYLAWRCNSPRWRLGLSSATLIFLWMVALVAFWERMWGVSFPLSAFVALMAQECHRMLARDLELGL